MMNGYDDLIRNHYDEVAGNEKDSPSSTMADLIIRQAETSYIEQQVTKFILQQNTSNTTNEHYAVVPGRGGDCSVLDVGCGNGYTLAHLNNIFPELMGFGMELNDSLRQLAESRFEKLSVTILSGDIRNPESLSGLSPAIVICQRVLINLLDEEDQKKALNNLIEVTPSGGLLIFCESFKTGLQNLNEARQEFGLSEISPAYHNLYLNDDFFCHPSIEVFDNESEFLLSKHYFISRVLHGFFLQKTDFDFRRNSHFVRFLSESLTLAGKYNPLRLYAFKKRDLA